MFYVLLWFCLGSTLKFKQAPHCIFDNKIHHFIFQTLWFCASCWNEEAEAALYCNWPSLLIRLQVLKCLVSQLADKMPKIARWECHNWRRIFPVCFAMHGSSEKSVIRHPQRVWCSAHPDLTPSILFRNALFNHSNIRTRVSQWFHVLSCHQIILIQN